MKNLIYFSIIILFFSCKKDDPVIAETPDTTPAILTVEFASEIMPIINSKACNNGYCHGGGSVPGISFGNHTEIAAIPTSKFLGAIKHEAGYDTMPRGGTKLSNQDIQLIETWINEGKNDN